MRSGKRMSSLLLATLSVLLVGSYAVADNFASTPTSIANFLQVTADIYRGARPTTSDLSGLIQNYQIHTDIDLENDSSVVASEQKAARGIGMQFLSTEIDPYTELTDAEVNGVLAQMQDTSNFPIFIHCHYGDDRTGLLVGLYRVEVQGWTPAAAYQEMLKDGFHPALIGLANYFRARTGYTGN
jgi:protein tyrosine/serine phosphatase